MLSIQKASASYQALSEKASLFYERYGLWLGLATAVLIPLRLSLAYVCLIPLITLWLLRSAPQSLKLVPASSVTLTVPLFIWVLVSFVGSLFGIDIFRSALKLLSMGFWIFAIPIYSDLVKRGALVSLLTALLCGQAVAAFHSVLEAAFSDQMLSYFVGTLSESGQLGLSIVVAIGFAFFIRTKVQSSFQASLGLILGIFNLALFLSFGFINHSEIGVAASLGLTILLIVAVSFVVSLVRRKNSEKYLSLYLLLLGLVVPLCLSASLLNLKRGPWFGILLGLSFFFLKFKRGLVVPLFALVLGLFTFVQPIQQRVVDSYEHFVIAGGRMIMWEIGCELAAKYPLGIGFKNSKLMQKLDPDIPDTHKHFHNNPINILVETGWLGFLVFIWWIYLVLKSSWQESIRKRPERFVTFAIGCAILSWQAAGLAEYNFGDSEVLLVALFSVGLLSGLSVDQAKSEPTTSQLD